MAPQGSRAPLEFGGPLGNGAKKRGATNGDGVESGGFDGYPGAGGCEGVSGEGAAERGLWSGQSGGAGGGCPRESGGGDQEGSSGKVLRLGTGCGPGRGGC